MSKSLIVKEKTQVGSQSNRKDILSIYGVPEMLDQIVKKEKAELLNSLACGTVVMDALNTATHAVDFHVEIPGGLREMLKTGKAAFDKSSKSPGGFTPNIRIIGESGIKGQATIVQKVDSKTVTNSLSNIAMMAMVQSVLAKCEVLEEKLDDIEKGQKNDRIGLVIAPFKGFMDLYPTFKTTEELNNAATLAYMKMQEGLAQLHLQIDNERKKLDKAPKNDWQSLWRSVRHPFHNEAERFQHCYEDYVYNIQLYNRLILLSDVILCLKGTTETIAKNHEVMVKYCDTYLDRNFQKHMHYLMNGKTSGIANILEYNKNIEMALGGELIKIECNNKDIKLLNNNYYGSKEC